MSSLPHDSIVCITGDGQRVTVLCKTAKTSQTLKNMMEDAVADEVPLPNVTGPIFAKVIEWATAHANDPIPIKKEEDRDENALAKMEVSTADKEFIAPLDQDTLFAVLLAANYFDMRPLLNLCCHTVAQSVLGKTPAEIYAMFKVEKELTPEEEAEVRKENPWLEDQ